MKRDICSDLYYADILNSIPNSKTDKKFKYKKLISVLYTTGVDIHTINNVIVALNAIKCIQSDEDRYPYINYTHFKTKIDNDYCKFYDELSKMPHTGKQISPPFYENITDAVVINGDGVKNDIIECYDKCRINRFDYDYKDVNDIADGYKNYTVQIEKVDIVIHKLLRVVIKNGQWGAICKFEVLAFDPNDVLITEIDLFKVRDIYVDEIITRNHRGKKIIKF